MLTDEVRGIVGDVLAIDGLSTAKTIELIRSRVDGASTEELITAAVALMREQMTRRIAQLEAKNEQLAEHNERLEEQVEDLETELEALRGKPAAAANALEGRSP